MVELQVVGLGGNRASVISADGSLIAGFASNQFADRNPTAWNGVTNQGSFVEEVLNSSTTPGEILGMNEGGSILVGTWNTDASTWTYPGLVRTTVGTGSIISGWKGQAMDIADDGTVVGFDILGGNRRAWIQPGGVGPLVDLKTWIQSKGGVVPSTLILEVCQAISNDGRKIIGHGNQTGAWIVTIDIADCTADVSPQPSGDGRVNIDDYTDVILNWGGKGPEGDATGDGVVNIDDYTEVILNWGPCPDAVGACCNGMECLQLTLADCTEIGGDFKGVGLACGATTCLDNDACFDAINIMANINGAVVQGDNSQATPPFGGGDPELPEGTPSCQFFNNPEAVHNTVWYKFRAPANGKVTISVCGSAPPFEESVMAMYSGSFCGVLTEVACDEDSCQDPPAWPYYPRLQKTGLIPGQWYWLCVANSGDTLHSVPGPFSLTITSP